MGMWMPEGYEIDLFGTRALAQEALSVMGENPALTAEQACDIVMRRDQERRAK